MTQMISPYFVALCSICLYFSMSVAGQTVAILTPDKTPASQEFAALLGEKMSRGVKLLDASLAESAYLSVSPPAPFNLTTDEGKRIGTAIGCDLFILLKSSTQRRSAYQRAEYYESYAAIYAVSSRTGRLIAWKLQTFEADKADKAARSLSGSAGALAAELIQAMRTAIKTEITESEPPSMEEPPDESSPLARATRAPIPYRRIKPEYTTQASLFNVAATVDLFVYLDEKGVIVRTESVRWAGFGLDESVERNVRSMNWRPAERNGKPMAMKFLVRYNFKKIE